MKDVTRVEFKKLILFLSFSKRGNCEEEGGERVRNAHDVRKEGE